MIKHLASNGVPKNRIAATLGVSRQTVYNHLSREAPIPKPREGRTSKLEPFKSYIRGRLEKFDLPATVLLAEIRRQGYAGGITILREFVHPLKAELVRRVTERFETVPGQQAQIDWGECGTLRVGGETKKLYVFVLVLGYSRMMYARFTTSSRLPALLDCLVRAFGVLGIPQEILVDNMKQAVETHDVTSGAVRWNRRFLAFAEHYGFLPAACPPYWPRAKGKVERGVGYIKTSFLEGRSFTDLADLNRQLEHWLDTVANVRVHGTTGERPCDRYAREVEVLRPRAAVPVFDTRPLEVRRVPSDCHVSFRGVRYSVHPKAVGQSVTLRPEGEDVGDVFTLYLGSKEVGRHQIRQRGTPRVTLPEHLSAIRELTRSGAGPAGRPRTRAPRFLQEESEVIPLALRLRESAPVVEVRELSLYEELLRENLLQKRESPLQKVAS